MLNLTNRQADTLAQLIDEAVNATRAAAIDQSARAAATRYLREYRLAEYHTTRHAQFVALAGELTAAAAALRGRQPPP